VWGAIVTLEVTKRKKYREFPDLKEAQMVIELWRVEYNTRRPHSALGHRPQVPVAHSPLVSPNPVSQPRAVIYTPSLELVQNLVQVS